MPPSSSAPPARPLPHGARLSPPAAPRRGPLAPVLSDYFDALFGMGEAVEVLRAGRVVAEGTLVAVDVWGRATVRLADGRELELAPEQAELRPLC